MPSSLETRREKIYRGELTRAKVADNRASLLKSKSSNRAELFRGTEGGSDQGELAQAKERRVLRILLFELCYRACLLFMGRACSSQ